MLSPSATSWLIFLLCSLPFSYSRETEGGDDYYSVLKVTKLASQAEIRKAFHAQALLWHPDKHIDNSDEANEMMLRINAAYAVLGDFEKRSVSLVMRGMPCCNAE